MYQFFKYNNKIANYFPHKHSFFCFINKCSDDTIIFYKHKDVTETEIVLNKELANVCDWFTDNKLSTHFGEGKT